MGDSAVAGYDLIGDIHGHADELRAILQQLSYWAANGLYQHSERKVVFLGDFIDRGPKIREVLDIVRSMVASGNALAVMGNHEYNALAFHTTTPGSDHESLRPRTVKNIRQHAATLQQLSDHDLASALDWFRTLPMWAEVCGPNNGVCRVVHACWDDALMRSIAQSLTPDGVCQKFLAASTRKGTALFDAVEIVLKGRELTLPAGASYFDKDGHKRTTIRTRWFEKPGPGTKYQSYVLQADPIDCDVEIDAATVDAISPYPPTSPPVFIGHYWLNHTPPTQLAPNVACLDYSVAKGGYLCAYRWDGEQAIDSRKFVWQPARIPNCQAS